MAPLGAKDARGFPQSTVGGVEAPEVGVLEGVALGTGVVVYTPLLEQPVVTRMANTATTAPSIVVWAFVLWAVVFGVVVEWVSVL